MIISLFVANIISASFLSVFCEIKLEIFYSPSESFLQDLSLNQLYFNFVFSLLSFF